MKVSNSKYFFLNSVNFLYLVCGISLIVGSITVLCDTDRILISRLVPIDTVEPILSYVCLAVLAVGLLVSTLSTVGCWAIYTENKCLLTTYIFGVLASLVGEGVFGVLTVMKPMYLGIDFDRNASAQLWKDSYGVPNREKFTVAIDLFQARFNCCGVEGGNDYKDSWWFIQTNSLHSPNLTVPISCCRSDNNLTNSYRDPVPSNWSLCQDSRSAEFLDFRHEEGCHYALENWLREQKLTVLFSVLVSFAVQILILVAVISSCVAPKQTVYDAHTKRTSHSYMLHNARY